MANFSKFLQFFFSRQSASVHGSASALNENLTVLIEKTEKAEKAENGLQLRQLKSRAR